jgi:hypothetical protein
MDVVDLKLTSLYRRCQDARIEVVTAHLPCPVSVVDDPNSAPIGVDSTDVDAYAGGRTKTDLSTWGIQAARSRETAKHVKSMVAELKAQVEIMRQTHGARQSQSANGSRPAQASLSTDFCRRPTAPQASEFAGLPSPCHRGNSTSGAKLYNASNDNSTAPYSRTGFTSDCGSAKDNNCKPPTPLVFLDYSVMYSLSVTLERRSLGISIVLLAFVVFLCAHFVIVFEKRIRGAQ